MAQKVVATGALTLTDLNDAKVLIANLKSNINKVQVFDPNNSTYTPSWVTTPVVITPELTIAGEAGDIISQAKSIKWYKDGIEINPSTPPSGFSVGTGTGKPLTINQNVMGSGINSLEITCKIVWTDTRVNTDIESVANIIFTKVTNGLKGNNGADGVNSVVASVWAPNGTSIRNGSQNLTLQCDLYNGTSLVTSGATYLWYKLVSGTWTALTSAYEGYNTKTLTVKPADIAGQSSFKCIATYNSKQYQDAITVNDFSDPITISLIPAEGTVFKNSVGEKNVICRVFQGIVGEIDPEGTQYEYRWYLTNADGTLYTDPSWVDTGKTYKTGKIVKVLASHINGTGGLQCELWTKS